MIIGAGVRYSLVEVNSLKQHEEIFKEHFEDLAKEIKTNRFVVPIIVDKDSLIILDGHHRYNVIRSLGYKFAPVLLVDYNDPSIKVLSWRNDVKVTKEEVLFRGLSGKLFPPKTSRHLIQDGSIDPNKMKIPLELLR